MVGFRPSAARPFCPYSHAPPFPRLSMNSSPQELKWLIVNLRAYWLRHLGAIATAILTSIFSLADPLIVGWVIDQFIKSPSSAVPLIGAGLVMAAYEIRLGLSAISTLWAADTYQKLVMDLRLRLLEHFDRLSLDYHEAVTLGGKSFILVDSVDDIAVVGAEVIPLLARSVFTGIAISLTMIIVSPRLSIILLSALPLYLFTTRHFKRQIRETTEAANRALDRMSQYVHEHLATIPQIQILSEEKRELSKAARLFADVKHYQKGRIQGEIRYTVMNGTITALTCAIVIGYGSHLALNKIISIGSLVVCYSYLARLFEPIGSIANAHTKFQKSASSIRRLQEFFAISPSVACSPLARRVRNPESILMECQDVCFSYNRDRMAVSCLTYTLQPGERISIIGRSGAGKSTAAKLIARLYDPQSGMVRINGDDLRSIELGQLRSLIHYMPQHSVLFTGTLEENLRYGNSTAAAPELHRAIEMARLEPVLQRMPRGLHEMLGPGGCQISGGERQRLALARAMLCRPRILILDEATAFLDVTLEAEIFAALRVHMPETTLIVISHRLPAVTWADRHLLMNQGKLVAFAPHHVLYRENSFYRELYDSAIEERSKFEAAAHATGTYPILPHPARG
jgi:ABC-type multidrug transport system fused ATPase/permease subunit